MFGDDLNPTVMTERAGFGEVSDTHAGGVWLSRSRGKQKLDWYGMVSTSKAIQGKVMKAKGETATMNECKF